MRTSTRCSQNKWRTLLAGGIKVFLTLFLLSFFTTGSYGQAASSPCTAHRWNSGEAWSKNTTTGLWTGVPATGQTQPQGVVGCASAAATESGLEAYKGTYNPADFAITGLSDCFDMNGNTFGVNSLAPPEPGEDIVWFNFDIRPLAGTYQFQVVSNQPIGWALYYVDPANARPNASDAGPTYPTDPIGHSGNCATLLPANITLSGVTHGNCGIQGNGWSTITVPSFNKPTNYYLAMWLAPTGTGEGKSTFPKSISLVYKSRYGCGGSTCTIESVGLPQLSCVNGGSGGYTVCQNFQGSAGRWQIQDPYALDGDPNTIPATSYTVTTYKQDQTTVVSSTTYTTLTSTSTLTLGIIPDGAVFAKICATYAAIGQPFSINLVPDPTYNGGADYVACGDGASFSGASPTLPTVDGTATPSTIDPALGNTSSLSAIASGGTSPYTYAWSQLNPDAFSSITNAGSANATFNLLSYPNNNTNLYNLKVTATDNIGCQAQDLVNIEIAPSLEPCGIYGPTPVCQTATGLTYTFGDAGTPYTLNTTNFSYTWSITGNGVITSSVTNQPTVTVNPTGSGSFTLTMTIDNITGILPDKTCTYTVTVNPTPTAPGAGPNARCGTGTVQLSATGCVGGTLNWYDAPTGGNLVGTGSTFNTPSISATTSYYVSCTVGDCVSPRTEVIATVNNAPGAPTGGPNERCGPGTVSLTASGCTGTLKWYDVASGGTSLGTGSPFTTPSLTATKTFYVSCTSADGCEGPRTAVVATVNDIPGAPTGGPNARCGTGTVVLTATGCEGGTLKWYDVPSGGTSIGTGSPFTTPSISATKTFYVSCTSAAGCEGPRTAVVATVNDIPATPQLTVVQPTCLIAASITVTSPVGDQYTYQLNGGTAQASPVFNNLAPGPYTVTATGTGGCTSSAANATINAVPDVPAAPGAGPNHRCGPGTVTLSATGCASGTLNWYDVPSGGTSLGTGSTFTTPSLTATKTFYVSCTVGDCVSPRTAVVATVNDIPGAPTGGPNARCGTGTVVLTATGCEGGTLKWYDVPSGGTSIGTGSPFTTPSISATKTFYVSCTSAAGCEGPRTAVVATVNDIPATPQLTVVQPTCLIAASITVTSPVGDQYTYQLNGGTAQASPVFNNLAPGPYTVTATGTGGCTSSAANATINAVPDVPAAPGAGPNHRCGPGTVTLSATGCASGTLNWYDVPSGGTSLGTGSTFTTPSLTATKTFYVSCTVGDCVSPRTAVVATVNDIPGAPTGGPNARCGTGTVVLTATGCEGGTLKWYDVPSGGTSIGTGSPFTTPSISATKTFYVSCTSAAGCEGPRTAVVATVNGLGAVTATSMPTTCGLQNGSITITAPLGADITYTVNGVTQSGTTFSNLPSGFYSIVAHSTAGCTSSGSATVGTSTNLGAVTATSMPTTCGLQNGSITITAPLGADITYTVNGVTQSGTTFSNLPSGFYSIVAHSTAGCTSSGSATVGTSTNLGAVTATSMPTTCGLQNGSITITAPLGADITYTVNGVTQSGTTFSNLPSGFYSIVAHSTAGCTSSGSATVGTSTNLGAVTATSMPTTCGLQNGSITITAPLGADITYTVNGVTQSGTTFSNLPSGFYSIVAHSTAGCTSSGSATVGTSTNLGAVTATSMPTTCGLQNGSITITAPLGADITYTVNGVTQSGTTFSNLPSGFYSIVAHSTAGCTSSGSATVGTSTNLGAVTATSMPTTCGLQNGSITITAPLGADITYTVNGVTQSGTTFSNLPSGFYSIVAHSTAGCTSSGSATVGTSTNLGAVTATSMPTTCGLQNGSITITAPLGADITYTVNGVTQSGTTFSNLPSGFYSIVAHSTAGCTSSGSATVGTSTNLGAVTATSMPTTCGLQNGSITITAPLGADITYTVNGVTQSGTTFSNLPSGFYSIVAHSTAGCTSSGSATVGTSTNLGAVTATSMPTTCGLQNGSITITAPLGADITYTVNGVTQSGTTFSNLPSGFYSIVAHSTAGCTSSGSATVGTSSILGAVIANGTPTTCGLNNGSIVISAPVGAGITYSLNGGTPQTSTTFSNLPAGTYSILARSTAGCTSSGSATVGGSQPCLTYCSYTQGFWGNKNGLKMLPALLTTDIVIGRAGHSFTIPSGSAVMLNNAMPGGSTPRALVSGNCTMSLASNGCYLTSYATKQGRINNVFLSQTITLTLNTRLAGNPLLTLPIRSGCLNTGKGSFQLNTSVVSYLTYNGASATVANLLDLANDLLGGALTPGANVGSPSKPRIVPSYSAVNDAVDAINNAFDGCTRFNGYQACVTSSMVVLARVAPEANTISDHVKVSAYPNPFTDKVRFTIKSSVSGQGSLDVFNMVGQKVKTVYQGYVHANTEQVVEYRVPDVSRQNLIFVMTVNGERVTGKLLNAKE